MKGLHGAFIAVSLVIHAVVIFRAVKKREPERIPIRMASTENSVRLEVVKPKEPPPVKRMKKKHNRKVAKKKAVEQPPPVEEEPLNQAVQQNFEESVLTQKAIIYPGSAARRGWEGVVYLELFIDESGAVEKVEVKRPYTYKILSDAAITGVRDWRFHPRADARHYSVLKKINFKLRNI